MQQNFLSMTQVPGKRRWRWWLLAAIVAILVPGLAYMWVLWKSVFDSDACHVIAKDLVDISASRPQGEVPQEEIVPIADRLTRGSVIVAPGGKDGFGGPIRARVHGDKLTCWTEGWVYGWGAVSMTVDLRK